MHLKDNSMETELRFTEEIIGQEYCMKTYHLLSKDEERMQTSMDMFVYHENSFMRNCAPWSRREEERTVASQEFKSSQSGELSTVSIKQEEDDNVNCCLQEMFPELANMYLSEVPFHGLGAIHTRPQDELYDVENIFAEFHEIRNIEAMHAEPQEELDGLQIIHAEPQEILHGAGNVVAEPQEELDDDIEIIHAEPQEILHGARNAVAEPQEILHGAGNVVAEPQDDDIEIIHAEPQEILHGARNAVAEPQDDDIEIIHAEPQEILHDAGNAVAEPQKELDDVEMIHVEPQEVLHGAGDVFAEPQKELDGMKTVHVEPQEELNELQKLHGMDAVHAEPQEMLHGAGDVFAEPQKELDNMEIMHAEPQEKLYDAEDVFAEPQKELDSMKSILTKPQKIQEETVEAKGENKYENDYVPLNIRMKDLLSFTKDEKIKKTEIDTSISQKTCKSLKKNASTKREISCTKRRRRNAESIVIKFKRGPEEGANYSVETIVNKTPEEGIEAVDLPSLLEKFEEIEKSKTLPNSHDKLTIKDIPAHRAESTNKTRGRPKKSIVRTLKHNVTQDLSPAKPTDVTKISETKKTVVTTPVVLNTKQCANNSKNTHQMRDHEYAVCSNHVDNTRFISSVIQSEHDYCTTSTSNIPVNNKQISEPHPNKKSDAVLQYHGLVSPNTNISATVNKTPATNEHIKIKSALARYILKSQKKKTEHQTEPRIQQMVSVLKNPPNPSQSLQNNMIESIITTSGSSNNEIQNIIQQDIENIPLPEIQKPVRKKLNLEEYRKKRGQVGIKNRTEQNKLVYVHNMYTMTEPFIHDDNEVYFVKEINTIIKSVSEISNEKSKPKTLDGMAQTDTTIFEYLDQRDIQNNSRSRSSSQPTSSTKSRNNSKTRDKSSNSRSRSRSRSGNRRASRSKNKSMHREMEVEKNRNRNKRSRNSSTSRSRSRSLSRSRTFNDSRYRSKSKSRNRSSSSSSRSGRQSRSRSRSSSRRHYSTYSKVRWTNYPDSRDSSVSGSHNSRSTSRYYSRRSRSPSVSNRERNRWSSNRGGSDRARHDETTRYSRSRYDQEYRRSPVHYQHKYYHEETGKEWKRVVEERRVVYVGGIADGTTKEDLFRRFDKFGSIVNININPRMQNGSYGFVTFAHKADAYQAVEHGNDGQSPQYNLSFGGRRAFCQSDYEDLDGAPSTSTGRRSNLPNESFDDLLQNELSRRRLA